MSLQSPVLAVWFAGRQSCFVWFASCVCLLSGMGSSLSFMRGLLPKYFSSEWSFAQYKVPEDASK